MGVTGLNKFVDENPELNREHELSNKRLIIDGSNFVYFLYTCSNADFVFGGDYKVFVDGILSYISSLRECCIEPIVVFDGGFNKSKETFEKRKKNYERRLERVYKIVSGINSEDWSRDASEEAILPINAYEVFKMVLYDIGVKVVQCEYKEDNPIAVLANEYQCPVLSKDTDFYIIDLRHGFIRLEDLNPSVQTDGSGRKYLKCKIYYIESFVSHFHLKEKTVLPLFAALILYRKEYFQDSKSFFLKIGVRRNTERFQKLLFWMRQYNLEDALRIVLRMTREDRKDHVEKFLRTHMSVYQLKSNLRYIVEAKADEIIQKSKLTAICGAKLPDNFILAFHKGMPFSMLTIITQHCVFLSPLIEDFSLESSHSCSRHIRSATYGVLLQHANDTHMNHRKNCLKIIDEFDRVQAIEGIKKIEVCYLTKLQNDVKVPMLTDIYQMAKPDLRNFITSVLGTNESFTKNFPSDLQLFFCCVNYWIKNCVPKPTESYVTSILLSVIYHQIKLSTLLDNKEALLFRDIPELETHHVLENFGKYLQVPTEKPYDFHIVHNYNQLQVCLLEAIQLNWLTESPFVSPKLQEIFSGTLLYNLVKKLDSSENPDYVTKRMLGNIDDIVGWFRKTKDILDNYYWHS